MLRTLTIPPVVATALALALAGTAAAQQDQRSPDVRYGHPHAKIDLVSPDARHGIQKPGREKIDLVSPDARLGVPDGTTVPGIVTVQRTRVVEVPRAGFEWGDAAIGGGAALALVMAATGLVLTVRPRRTAAASTR